MSAAAVASGAARFLEGRVALITGAGGGQGRAACQLFAAAGATVVASDINATTLAETTDVVRAEGGSIDDDGGVVDLGDPDSARAWVDDAATRHGHVDIVYNNAGAGRFEPIGEMSLDAWHSTMRNELHQVFYMVRWSWRHLAARGGVIINIASVAGHNGDRNAPGSAHCAAKGAILALTRQLAVEGADVGVRAVSISPGLIETPATRTLMADPAIRAALVGGSLTDRPGRPDEVASLALYLASDQASFINGSDFIIDGGRMAL